MNPNPFARLLGVQRTTDARERLHALRQRYALTENDPVWELVAIFEEFCVELKLEAARSGAPTLPPDHAETPSGSRALDRRRIFVLCSAGAALQTFLLAIAAYVGAHMTLGAGWLGAALSVPAGWVMFALLLPLLATVTFLGWRARHAEPAMGWTLVLCGTSASATLFVTLWSALG
jgi:hypothetical protein